MCYKPVELFIILVTTFLSAITSLKKREAIRTITDYMIPIDYCKKTIIDFSTDDMTPTFVLFSKNKMDSNILAADVIRIIGRKRYTLLILLLFLARIVVSILK